MLWIVTFRWKWKLILELEVIWIFFFHWHLNVAWIYLSEMFEVWNLRRITCYCGCSWRFANAMSVGSPFQKAMNPQLMNLGQLESLVVLRILIAVSCAFVSFCVLLLIKSLISLLSHWAEVQHALAFSCEISHTVGYFPEMFTFHPYVRT